MKHFLKSFWQDESAQGTAEYILMLVIVVGIAMAFKNQIGDIIQQKVSEVGGQIQGFSAN